MIHEFESPPVGANNVQWSEDNQILVLVGCQAWVIDPTSPHTGPAAFHSQPALSRPTLDAPVFRDAAWSPAGAHGCMLAVVTSAHRIWVFEPTAGRGWQPVSSLDEGPWLRHAGRRFHGMPLGGLLERGCAGQLEALTRDRGAEALSSSLCEAYQTALTAMGATQEDVLEAVTASSASRPNKRSRKTQPPEQAEQNLPAHEPTDALCVAWGGSVEGQESLLAVGGKEDVTVWSWHGPNSPAECVAKWQPAQSWTTRASWLRTDAGWRLVLGHASGEVQLWQLTRHSPVRNTPGVSWVPVWTVSPVQQVCGLGGGPVSWLGCSDGQSRAALAIVHGNAVSSIWVPDLNRLVELPATDSALAADALTWMPWQWATASEPSDSAVLKRLSNTSGAKLSKLVGAELVDTGSDEESLPAHENTGMAHGTAVSPNGVWTATLWAVDRLRSEKSGKMALLAIGCKRVSSTQLDRVQQALLSQTSLAGGPRPDSTFDLLWLVARLVGLYPESMLRIIQQTATQLEEHFHQQVIQSAQTRLGPPKSFLHCRSLLQLATSLRRLNCLGEAGNLKQLQSNEMLLLAIHIENELDQAACGTARWEATAYLLMLDWVAMHANLIPGSVRLAAEKAAKIQLLAGSALPPTLDEQTEALPPFDPPEREVCPLSGAGVRLEESHKARSLNGHWLDRCSQSLMVISSTQVMRCAHCGRASICPKLPSTRELCPYDLCYLSPPVSACDDVTMTFRSW